MPKVEKFAQIRGTEVKITRSDAHTGGYQGQSDDTCGGLSGEERLQAISLGRNNQSVIALITSHACCSSGLGFNKTVLLRRARALWRDSNGFSTYFLTIVPASARELMLPIRTLQIPIADYC